MTLCTRPREREKEGVHGCKGSSGVEPRVNPPFSSALFLRGRLGVSFDHICILVMKFAPGPVISVYLTDFLSHSLRTGALIGHFKSGLRCRRCRCILLTDNISGISGSSLPRPPLFRRYTSRNIAIFSRIYFPSVNVDFPFAGYCERILGFFRRWI